MLKWLAGCGIDTRPRRIFRIEVSGSLCQKGDAHESAIQS